MSSLITDETLGDSSRVRMVICPKRIGTGLGHVTETLRHLTVTVGVKICTLHFMNT